MPCWWLTLPYGISTKLPLNFLPLGDIFSITKFFVPARITNLVEKFSLIQPLRKSYIQSSKL